MYAVAVHFLASFIAAHSNIFSSSRKSYSHNLSRYILLILKILSLETLRTQFVSASLS